MNLGIKSGAGAGLLQNSQTSHQKLPRLFLPVIQDQVLPMDGLILEMPNQQECAIFDISHAGILMEAVTGNHQYRIGDHFFVKLKSTLEGQYSQKIPVKLMQMGKKSWSLVLDMLSPAGRIQMSAEYKDLLIFENLNHFNPEKLDPQLKSALWYHGPFETNILVWNSEGLVQEFWIEYDNICLKFKNGKFELSRSGLNVGQGQNYWDPWVHTVKGNVALGQRHLDKVLALLDRIEIQTKALALKGPLSGHQFIE